MPLPTDLAASEDAEDASPLAELPRRQGAFDGVGFRGAGGRGRQLSQLWVRGAPVGEVVKRNRLGGFETGFVAFDHQLGVL